MRKISDFLLILGGYTPSVVAAMPQHFRIRYHSAGLAIMVTCVAAFFGMLHTGLHYFDNVFFALLLAFIWVFCIGIIEHQIVVFMTKDNKILVSVVRILASLVFSIIISTPLVLALCAGPIQERILHNTHAKIENLKKEYEAHITNGRKQIEDKTAAYNTALNAANNEASGRKGSLTGKYGEGPITKRLDSKANELKRQLDDEKERYNKDIFERKVRLENDIKAIKNELQNDELTQFRTLLHLVKEDGAIRFRFMTLWLALLFLELLPVILKLSSSKNTRDPYLLEIEKIETEAEIQNMGLKKQLFERKLKDTLDKNIDRINTTNELRTHFDYIQDGPLRNGLKNQYINSYIDEIFSNDSTKAKKRKQKELTKPVLLPQPYHITVTDYQNNDSPFSLSSAIANYAIDLCSQAATEQDKVEILFDFVRKHVTYDQQHETFLWGYRNAMESYIDKRAICGESSFLFIALARVVGLRADFVHVEVDCNNTAVNHACALANGQLVDIAYGQIDAQHIKVHILKDKEVETRFKSWRIIDPTDAN